MPLPRYYEAIALPAYQNAPVEKRQEMNDQYWKAYFQENPDDEWGKQQAADSTESLRLAREAEDASPVAKRALELNRSVLNTNIQVRNRDLGGGWKSPEEREQFFAQKEAELAPQRQAVKKTFSLFKPEVEEQMQPTWNALQKYALDSGIFGEQSIQGVKAWEKRDTGKLYRDLRDTVAKDFNLMPEEVDDLVKHRMGLQEDLVSRDAVGGLHIKNELLSKNTDEIEKAIEESSLPPTTKENLKGIAPLRIKVFKEETIQNIKQNFPEFAKEVKWSNNIDADYENIRARLVRDEKGGYAAMAFSGQLLQTVGGVGYYTPGLFLDKLTNPLGLSSPSQFWEDVGNKGKALEAATQLSRQFNGENLKILGFDAATLATGVYSVAESVGINYATGGLGSYMITPARIARAGKTGKFLLEGTKRVADISPLLGIYGMRQGLDTYERTGNTNLAFLDAAIEMGVTGAFSFLPKLGGVEDIGQRLANPELRKQIAKSVAKSWGQLTAGIARDFTTEQLEEQTINVLREFYIESKINPGRTVNDLKKSAFDTLGATLAGTAGPTLISNTVEQGTNLLKPTYERTDTELHDVADATLKTAAQENLPETETEGGTVTPSGDAGVAAPVARMTRQELQEAIDDERQRLERIGDREIPGPDGKMMKNPNQRILTYEEKTLLDELRSMTPEDIAADRGIEILQESSKAAAEPGGDVAAETAPESATTAPRTAEEQRDADTQEALSLERQMRAKEREILDIKVKYGQDAATEEEAQLKELQDKREALRQKYAAEVTTTTDEQNQQRQATGEGQAQAQVPMREVPTGENAPPVETDGRPATAGEEAATQITQAETRREGEAAPAPAPSATQELVSSVVEKVKSDDVDLRAEVTESGIQLFGISVPKIQQRKGKATKAVAELKAVADQSNLPITLTVEPSADMSKASLINWYSKQGFELQDDGDTMVYSPKQKTPNLSVGQTYEFDGSNVVIEDFTDDGLVLVKPTDSDQTLTVNASQLRQPQPTPTNENQIQETGGTPPVESVPAQPAAEGEAQAGTSQRQSQGQQKQTLTPEAVKEAAPQLNDEEAAVAAAIFNTTASDLAPEFVLEPAEESISEENPTGPIVEKNGQMRLFQQEQPAPAKEAPALSRYLRNNPEPTESTVSFFDETVDELFGTEEVRNLTPTQQRILKHIRETMRKFTRRVGKGNKARLVVKLGSIRMNDLMGQVWKMKNRRSPGWRNYQSTDDVRARARVIAYEIVSSMTKNGSGVDWYKGKIAEMYEKLSRVYPELREEGQDRFIFSTILAITSNGENVFNNMDNAVELYERVRGKGRMPAEADATGLARREEAMFKGFARVQQEIDKVGWEQVHKDFKRDVPYGEVKKKYRIKGNEERADQVVSNAYVLGAKIGAFWGNLNGNFKHIAMDLWFTRTMARLSGDFTTISKKKTFDLMKEYKNLTYEESVPEEVRAELQNYINSVPKNDDSNWTSVPEEIRAQIPLAYSWIKKTRDAYARRKDPVTNKGFYNGSLVEKIAKKAHGYLDEANRAPENADHRLWMRRVVRAAQRHLKDNGIDLSLAEMQAVMWFYEKDLYTKFGGTSSMGERADFSQAADNTLKKRKQQVFTGDAGPRAEDRQMTLFQEGEQDGPSMLRDPEIKLTEKERDKFNWIKEAFDSALEDDVFVGDNPQLSTLEGQLEELRYRVEDAESLVEGTGTVAEMRADRNVIRSLAAKLEKAGYFNPEYHARPTLFQSQQQPKGQITFAADMGKAWVKLMKHADISTFHHELAHFLRRFVIDTNNEQALAAAQRRGITREEIDKVAKWAGVKEDGVWTREAEEKFARAVERYLRDGKAPTSALQPLFDKLSAWLKNIYKSLEGASINIEITDDVRQVFDKLFAGPQQQQQQAPAAPAPTPQAKPKSKFKLPPSRSTSLKNAATDRYLAENGMAPILGPARQSNQETWDLAMGRVARDDRAGTNVVNAILNSERSVTDEVEEGVLLHELAVRKARVARYRKAVADAHGNEDAVREAKRNLESAQVELGQVITAAKLAGTAWGRIGQFRQRAIKEDFSLEAMEARFIAEILDGESFESAKKRTGIDYAEKVKELHKRITEAEKATAEAEAALELKEREVQALLTKMEKEVKEVKTRKAPERKTVTERVSLAAKSARERLAARGVRGRALEQKPEIPDDAPYEVYNSKTGEVVWSGTYGQRDTARRVRDRRDTSYGANIFKTRLVEDKLYQDPEPTLDPEDIEDLAAILNEYVVKGDTESDAVEKLAGEFGEIVMEYDDKILATAKEQLAKAAAGSRAKTPTELFNLLEPDKPISNRLVYNMVRGFISMGVEKKQVLNKVLSLLKKKFPTLTYDELSDIFTGYGKIKEPDPSKDAKAVRELREIERMERQLREIEAGNVPKKTGLQRDPITPDARALRRKIMDALRKMGIRHRSTEAQLAGALDSLKTRLKNEIADLDKAVADKIALVRRKTKSDPDSDPEIVALRKKRAESRAKYDQFFGVNRKEMSDEKRLIGLIKHLNRRIKEERELAEKGILERAKAKKGRISNAEAESLRATLNSLVEARVAAKAALHPAISEAGRALSRARSTAQRQLDYYNRIKAGLPTDKKAPMQLVPGEELARMLTLVADAKAAVKEMRREQKKATAKTKEAREREASIRALERSVAVLEERVKRGDLSTKSRGKIVGPLNEAETELKKRQEAAQATLKALKEATLPSLEERRLNALIKASETRRKKIEARIAAGDYVKVEKAPKVLDDRLAAARLAESKAKEAWNRGFFEKQLSERTFGKKVYDTAAEILNFSRTMKTIGDVSAVLRQGMVTMLTRPVLSLQAIPGMFRAGLSEVQHQKLKDKIESHPLFALSQQAKLFIAESGPEGTLAKVEEAFRGRWAKKIPGIASITGFSERTYNAYLNQVRMASFANMVEGFAGGKPTLAEAKVIAAYVNRATGRGDLKQFESAAAGLAALFFSPKFVVSRFQVIWGAVPATFNAATGFKFVPDDIKRAKKAVSAEYARLAIGIAAVYSLAMLAKAGFGDDDDKWETDPRSTNFGKIKIGGITIDPMGGLLQAFTFGARMLPTPNNGVWSAHTKTQRGDVVSLWRSGFGKQSYVGVMGQFLRTKLSPVPASVINVMQGEDVIGQPVTVRSEVIGSVMPLVAGDVFDNFRAHGIAGTPLAVAVMFGMGVRNETEGLELEQYLSTFVGVNPQEYERKKSSDTRGDKLQLELKPLKLDLKLDTGNR